MTSVEDAIALRDEERARFLRDYLKVDPPRRGFQAFSLGDLEAYVPPDRRLAFGVAFGSDFQLALRVPRRDGLAHKAALDIVEREKAAGRQVDLKVIERIAAPSKAEVAEVPPSGHATAPAEPDELPPLELGVSVSHPRGPAGSLGGFIRIRGAGEGIIGACHVLANSGRGAETADPANATPIYHPARIDAGRPLTARDRIGRLYDYVPLDADRVEVDVAVATLEPNRRHSGNELRFPKGRNAKIKPPPTRDEIMTMSSRSVGKVGRSTGYTDATLTAGLFKDIGLDVPGHGLVYYDNLYEIESIDDTGFALPGDSGAAVFDLEYSRAFAMVVGGGLSHDVTEFKGAPCMLVYACDLAAALKAVNAEWL